MCGAPWTGRRPQVAPSFLCCVEHIPWAGALPLADVHFYSLLASASLCLRKTGDSTALKSALGISISIENNIAFRLRSAFFISASPSLRHGTARPRSPRVCALDRCRKRRETETSSGASDEAPERARKDTPKEAKLHYKGSILFMRVFFMRAFPVKFLRLPSDASHVRRRVVATSATLRSRAGNLFAVAILGCPHFALAGNIIP